MYKNGSATSGKLFRKRNFVILFIAMIFIYSFGTIFLQNKRTKEWGKESRYFTDNFMELLTDKDYQGLFEKYTSYKGKNADDLKSSLNKLYQLFGDIKSYEYAGPSSSSAGQFGPLTSFYLIYHITFDSGKIYQGDFNIAIDRQTNAPETGKILSFGVSGDLEKNEMFYLRLFE